MTIKDFIELTDHLRSEMVMTILVGGIAYPIDNFQIYKANAGKRLLLIPNIKVAGSIPIDKIGASHET